MFYYTPKNTLAKSSLDFLSLSCVNKVSTEIDHIVCIYEKWRSKRIFGIFVHLKTTIPLLSLSKELFWNKKIGIFRHLCNVLARQDYDFYWISYLESYLHCRILLGQFTILMLYKVVWLTQLYSWGLIKKSDIIRYQENAKHGIEICLKKPKWK